MAIIFANASLGLSKDLTITGGASGVITPASNDELRIIIGRIGRIGNLADNFAAAELFFTSDAPTAAGSSITKGATNRLRLDAGDLTFLPGVYTMFFDLFDNADATEWKNISRQVFVLEA